jgi:uncharacterized protein (DUF305 family)
MPRLVVEPLIMKAPVLTAVAIACAWLTAGPQAKADRDAESHPMAAVTTHDAFDQAMGEAMRKMDEGMAVRHTGNPDRDFAAMMIPHHQGAIDMARAELAYGRDPVLRRLAQGIIVEQQQEIEVMRRQLERTGHAAQPMQPEPRKE